MEDESGRLCREGAFVLDEKPIPDIGPQDALIRVTTTTICGTDVHILQGEYPVAKGLTIGHEPVGFIEKLGSGITGFKEGGVLLPARSRRPAGVTPACVAAAPRSGRIGRAGTVRTRN